MYKLYINERLSVTGERESTGKRNWQCSVGCKEGSPHLPVKVTISKDLEVKYIRANICRRNIPSRGNKHYTGPEVGVIGIFENSNEASVAVMERAGERTVKAGIREAKGRMSSVGYRTCRSL